MADVALTAALRSNLLSLQGTQRLLDTTQLRLATGLKVNSPLDDPQSFFAAQSLNNRGSDLSRLLDSMGQAVQTLKAADDGIKAMTVLLEQATSIATEAKAAVNADADKGAAGTGAGTSSGNSGLHQDTLDKLDALAENYDEVLRQITSLANDASYRGINLLKGTGTLKVEFSETANPSQHDVTGIDFGINDDGSRLADFTTNFAVFADITNTAAVTTDAWDGTQIATFAGDLQKDTALTAIQNGLDNIKTDLATLRTTASSYGASLNIIQTRQDFTSNLINTLRGGADKLTLADKNEEGAKLLSLQTTQQLGITSLALASQSNQAVLRLFG